MGVPHGNPSSIKQEFWRAVREAWEDWMLLESGLFRITKIYLSSLGLDL